MSDRLSMAVVNRYNLAISAGAVAASYGLVTPFFAASLALGALLETVSFRSLWRFYEGTFFPSGGGAGPALGAFGVRFILLGAAIFVALWAGVHPIGLVLGLSLIVPALLLAAWRMRPLPAATAGELTPPDDPVWDEWDPWLARERPPEDEEEDA